jgi:hypothetical protein
VISSANQLVNGHCTRRIGSIILYFYFNLNLQKGLKMKRLLVLILCGWVALLWSQEYPASEETRINPAQQQLMTDRQELPKFAASEPCWKVLERMNLNEQQNSLISVELINSASLQAVSIANNIENLWNSGQYSGALTLFNQLAEKVGRQNIAIGRSWKRPLTNPQGEMWGDNVRIGTRDSIYATAFDIHRASGYLFAILLYQEGSSTWYWSVNLSQDGGQTWLETYSWWANYEITTIDAAVVGDHCYVGYNIGDARLRRFQTSDGAAVNFTSGAVYLTVFTSTSDTLGEIALASNQDAFDNRLYYSAIQSDGGLRFYWGLGPDYETWYEITSGVTSASRGLDITFNQNYNDHYEWISYIDNVNILHIDGVLTSDTWDQVWTHSVGPASEVSSIGAFGDTVTCAFEYTGDLLYNKYLVSYTGGTSWAYGFLDDTTTINETPSLTARAGGGVAMAYRFYTPTREGRFIWRFYRGTWSTPEVYSDYEPYYIKPSIEYLGYSDYGVVYLSWRSPYVRAAYFDRRSWTFNPPQYLTALSGYHNGVILTWDAPADNLELNSANRPIQSGQNISILPEQKEVSQPVQPMAKFSAGTGSGKSDINLVNNHIQRPTKTELAFLSYNIYRSTVSSGPYDFLANVQQRYYRDLSTTNSTTYYYVVEAVYESGVSGYSNEAYATPVLNGNVIRSEAAGTAPTIDGVINASEWSQATATEITAVGVSNPVMLYSMNDLNYLYLALDDPNNTVTNDYDEFGIYFDDDNNFEWPPASPSNEGNFWIDYYTANPSTARFRGISGWWPGSLLFDDPIDATAVVHGISFSTGHAQFEVQIDLSASQLNTSAGSSFGIYLFGYDGAGVFSGYWPEETYNYWSLPAAYGTMILDPVTGIDELQPSMITAYELLPNYPNPFNPSTTICYRLANTEAQQTVLNIYNSSGQLIQTLVDQPQNNGEYSVTWDGLNSQGKEVGSGVYFYQLKSGNFTQTHKLLKMK